MDIIFHTDEYVFSYRVAGICVQNRKVLLQKIPDETGYAFPGGHVELGETNAGSLIREFKEEIGADVSVGDLKWVGEIFFPWGDKPCHQICLYYMVDILSDNIPKDGTLKADEHLEGRDFNVEFQWVPLEDIKNIEIYPTNVGEFLDDLSGGVKHFIYKE